MRAAIELRNIGKKYSKNLKKVHQSRSKVESFFSEFSATLSTNDQFWALQNVSASIMPGEIVGIIGKNGSGKSTLLKILSRITAPTSGSATLSGRVGSLLEVGTGFHPELTGRENVFLNGYILGMSHGEIEEKFSSIVEFSGIEEFIETPIKRYSSGMQARLAFAVAAHLEPEIMIVDEVLAVGDAEFQKRCLGKMQEVAKHGRTVLFVSHNMNAIRNLCTRCIWLNQGKIVHDSKDVDWVVGQYLSHFKNDADITYQWSADDNQSPQFEEIIPRSINITDQFDQVVNREIASDEEVTVNVVFQCIKNITNLSIGYGLYDENSNLVYISYVTDSNEWENINHPVGEYKISSALPINVLNDGEYTLQLIAGIPNSKPILSRDSSNIFIRLNIQGGKKRSSTWTSIRPSYIAPVIKWEQKKLINTKP